MQKKNIHFLTQAAMIAALYVVLTFIANAFGLANYAVQVRFSEALTILPIFTTAGIPGLFIGCIISNVLTGCALPDIIFGSIATPSHYCQRCYCTSGTEIRLRNRTSLVLIRNCYSRRDNFLWSAWPHTCRGAE